MGYWKGMLGYQANMQQAAHRPRGYDIDVLSTTRAALTDGGNPFGNIGSTVSLVKFAKTLWREIQELRWRWSLSLNL